MNLQVIDLHCDLLSYLKNPNASPLSNEIGCKVPAMEQGNVKVQVMAIYSSTEKGSSHLRAQQSQIFRDLLMKYPDRLALCNDTASVKTNLASSKIGILAAIENASSFCEEDESLESGFKKLETLILNTERIFYIGLTHHGENRFGGCNTTKAGLKEDGEILLEYISGRKIAIDLSHTSDALAYELLDHLSKKNLEIPIIASHSNFRTVFEHARNLPDDLAKEIIKRKGLIGMNFLRAFLNNENSEALYEHIHYGIGMGAENALCFGADYFFTANHPDQSRIPFYYKEQENAGCYPAILQKISASVPSEQLKKISSQNFMEMVW